MHVMCAQQASGVNRCLTEFVVGLHGLNDNFQKGEHLLSLFDRSVPEAWLGHELQASIYENKRKTGKKTMR